MFDPVNASVFVGLLCSFNHENVLSIKDLIIPLNESGQCEDLYIITELLDTDLSKVIYSPQPLIDDHCQYFVYQVFFVNAYNLSCRRYASNLLHLILAFKVCHLIVTFNLRLSLFITCAADLARSEISAFREGAAS